MPQRPKLLRAIQPVVFLGSADSSPGLPMAVFLLVAMFGLIRALRVDYAAAGIPQLQALTESPPAPEDDSGRRNED